MTGFGWSFYGFFLVAALWIAAYFAWAWWKNRQETGDRRPEAAAGPAPSAQRPAP